MPPREQIAERLREAGVDANRFIQCLSEEKKSHDHNRTPVDAGCAPTRYSLDL